jgi:nicotinate dehydrogenase subunit B
MTKMDNPQAFSRHALSRRAVLKAGGALIVAVGAAGAFDAALAANDALVQGTRPPLVPSELSSYIAVNADGSVSAFFGKTDMAQGLYTAIGQIVAEELDVRFERVSVFMGDTETSVNQGGASGSTGIQDGGKQMRMAAAEARRVLVELAAEKLGLPADQLTVTDGVVYAVSDAAKKISYAELVGGEGPEGSQGRRPADQALRHRAESLLPGRLRRRCDSARHGARPCRASAALCSKRSSSTTRR